MNTMYLILPPVSPKTFYSPNIIPFSVLVCVVQCFTHMWSTDWSMVNLPSEISLRKTDFFSLRSCINYHRNCQETMRLVCTKDLVSHQYSPRIGSFRCFLRHKGECVINLFNTQRNYFPSFSLQMFLDLRIYITKKNIDLTT